EKCPCTNQPPNFTTINSLNSNIKMKKVELRAVLKKGRLHSGPALAGSSMRQKKLLSLFVPGEHICYWMYKQKLFVKI
ncbi:MAG: hypothetical protein MI975_03875, partial [Cytophagales bacterium]|nr:hypothetical protein [Cytophagales bacterium]